MKEHSEPSKEETKLQSEQKTVEVLLKQACMEFFYYWWNEPGNNTEQGFDKWIQTEDGKQFASQFKSQLPIEKKDKFVKYLESEADKFQKDGGNSEYFAGGIRYAAHLVRLDGTEDARQPLGIAHLMKSQLPIEGGKSLYDTINEALRDFRLSYIFDENREGLHLSDRLSPDEDTTVTLGLQEIEYLTEHIVEAIKDLPIEGVEREWISVEERLPESNGPVIAYDTDSLTPVKTLNFEDGRFYYEAYGSSLDYTPQISMWMPLPSPPKNG